MTDFFRKAKSLFSTTLSSSIGSGIAETITLASVTGLPVDTDFTITIDRVDADGNQTPTKMERITGTIVGSNLTSYTRGMDGTTDQPHTSGAIIEYIWNAADLNDMVDGILEEHDQTGAHAKATGAEINTGAEENKLITPKGLADSAIPTATSTTTFTNKRVTPRVLSATNYTTDTGTSLNCDTTDMFIVTAQAGALKLNNPTGTPTNGQKLWIAITGTAARALTYDTQYESSAGATLPTTTVTTARIDIGLTWRADTSKWHCVAVS